MKEGYLNALASVLQQIQLLVHFIKMLYIQF